MISVSKKEKTRNILEWILVASMPFQYAEIFVVLFLLCYIGIHKWKGIQTLLFTTLILLFNVVISFIIYDYNINKSFQQLFLVGTHWVAYLSFFYYCNNLDAFLNKYNKYCEIIAYFGVAQIICIIAFHFDPFALFSNNNITEDINEVRIHSFFAEAGYMATFLVPYIIHSFLTWSETRKSVFFIVFSCYILSFSTAGYAALLFFALYKIVVSKYKLVSLIIIPVTIICFVLNYEGFSRHEGNNSLSNSVMKAEETIEAFSDLDPYQFESLNASTYATMTNLWVAINAPNRIFGTGIGTHGQNYRKLYSSDYRLYGLNQEDAFSLFIRIFSEFGYIGLLVVFILIIKGFNSRNTWNTAILFYFFAMMVRGGHYTLNGIFFFIMMYYYTSNRKKGIKIHQNSQVSNLQCSE